MKVAQEIQDAARAVVDENRRLRTWIEELQKGREDTAVRTREKDHRSSVADKLESELKATGSWEDNGAVSKPTTGLKTCDSKTSAIPDPTFQQSTPSPTLIQRTSVMEHDGRCPTNSVSQKSQGYVLKEASISGNQTDNERSESSERKQVDEKNIPTPPRKIPTHSQTQTPNATSPTLREELDTTDDTSSCAFAVSVLTSMRTDVSTEELQADLGCATGFEDCKIDNKRLFGAVDKYTN